MAERLGPASSAVTAELAAHMALDPRPSPGPPGLTQAQPPGQEERWGFTSSLPPSLPSLVCVMFVFFVGRPCHGPC